MSQPLELPPLQDVVLDDDTVAQLFFDLGQAAELVGVSVKPLGGRRAAAAEDAPRGPTDAVVRLIAFAFATFFVASAIFALVAPEAGWDALSYHLPRLGYWRQFRAVIPFLANNPRIGLFPVNGNILQLPPVLFLATDRLCPLVELIYGFGAAATVYTLGRSLDATRASSAVASLLWLSIPAVSLQIITSQGGLVMSFFFAATGYFVRRDVAEPSRAHLLTALTAGALAVGTKPQTSLVLLLLGVLLVARMLGPHRASLRTNVLASAGLAAFVGLPFYAAMLFRLGDVTGLGGLTFIHVHPAVGTLTKNVTLCLSPLLVWLFKKEAATDPCVPHSDLTDAYLGNDASLGLTWVLVAIALGTFLVWKRRPTREGLLISPGFLGLVSIGITLFVMRHQPAVVRFILPAAALVSAAFAPLFDALPGRARDVGRGLALGLSLPLLVAHGVENLKSRVTPLSWAQYFERQPNRLDLRTDLGRYPKEVHPALLELAWQARAGNVRLGLISSSTGFERMAFGERFEVTVVPLSYALPQSPEEIARLEINAFLLSSWPPTGFTFYMLKHEMPSGVAIEEGLLPTCYRDFDEPFRRAVGATMWQLDATPLINMLTLPDSKWVFPHRGEGTLLALKARY